MVSCFAKYLVFCSRPLAQAGLAPSRTCGCLCPVWDPAIHEASLPNWMTEYSGMGGGVIIGPSE